MTTTSGSRPASPTDAFRAARDQLLDLRGLPGRAAEEFAWPDIGDTYNFAIDWFDANARGNDRPCLVLVSADGTTESISFDRMARRSDQVAGLLSDHGVRRDDAVVVMLDNQVELWEAMLAIIKIGAVIMPTTTAVGPGDLVDRMDRGRARAVITNASETHKFDAVPGDYVRVAVPAATDAGLAPGWLDLHTAYDLDVVPAEHPGNASTDRMLLYFTSGTTSKPKLVEHTHVSYPVGHLSTMYWLGLRPGDVHLNISSPGWAKHAWSCFFAPWIAQATVFVYNYTRFEPSALLETLQKHDVTSLCAPPTVWRMLIASDLGERPASLREVIGAGEPLNPEIIEQVRRAWGLTLRDGYGQTETTASVGNVPDTDLKPGSMGHALPGVPLTLVDPITGRPAEPGHDGTREGELCLDLGRREGATPPLTLMTGYQGDPERNAEATAGGFYHTGDLAAQDADGYITYVGRTDDVFKASDYKISPFELESVLIEHPAVAEAAVVPAPDSVRLAVPKAYVALAAGHAPSAETAESILRHARERVPAWQRIRRIEFFDLPKTISGKIRRVELRLREAEAPSDHPREGGVIGDGREWRDDDFDLRQ